MNLYEAYLRDNAMEIYMIELRGKAVADAHKSILQEKMVGLEPGTIKMAVLLVGDDHGANMYADFMEKTAKNFGYGFVRTQLPSTATHEEVYDALMSLNNDDAVHGILPLMPMPKQINTEQLINLAADGGVVDVVAELLGDAECAVNFASHLEHQPCSCI